MRLGTDKGAKDVAAVGRLSHGGGQQDHVLRSSSLVPGVGAQALLAGRQSYWLIMICLCTTWWILDIGADLGGWDCGAPGFSFKHMLATLAT